MSDSHPFGLRKIAIYEGPEKLGRDRRARSSHAGLAWHIRTSTIIVSGLLLAACAGDGGGLRPAADPQLLRAQLTALLPDDLADRSGWARDIEQAFVHLKLPADAAHLCAALAITEQESSYRADPSVPNLPKLARDEIFRRASRLHIPALAVRIALQLEASPSMSFDQRLDRARTERELSELYEDFTAKVPLGRQLLAGWNPVRTGGPMQVSIAYAEQHLRKQTYPYAISSTVRDEVFSRRGGMYFGIAHLLDYPSRYDRMIYRFADFNAGHYASRNAAFQRALGIASQRTIALDGDLIAQGSSAGAAPGETESAVRSIASRIGMSDQQIRAELMLGNSAQFDDSRLHRQVFALADPGPGKRLPRAVLPEIRLQGPKISRKLTTAWFANRVDGRYQRCLRRAQNAAGQ